MSTFLFYAVVVIVGGAAAFLGAIVFFGLLAYFLEAKGYIKNEGPAGESRS
jgi:hypothetical protein